MKTTVDLSYLMADRAVLHSWLADEEIYTEREIRRSLARLLEALKKGEHHEGEGRGGAS